jgi:hypothetical protein
LQSRYYAPALGRFLNADSYSSTGKGCLGYNMFTYCNNNPIINQDPSGELLITTLIIASLSSTYGGEAMAKKCLTPDRTIENVWIVLRASKQHSIVLSCKNCQNGVSPVGSGYLTAAKILFCLLFMGIYTFFHSFVYVNTSVEWSKYIKELIAIVLTSVCLSAVVPLSVILTLGFSKWRPASTSEMGNTACKNSQE